MFPKPPIAVVLRGSLFAASLIGMLQGCSTERYKAQADEEVYTIIEAKWKDNLGPKANYKIQDVNESTNNEKLEESQPISGTISLAQAVAIATAQSRDYQTQKEQLYLTTLNLTSVRHDFARRWFGTIDADYLKDSEDESLSYDAKLGFNQLLADGAQVTTSIAIDWLRFLTGDPDTSLGTVLSASITQPLLRASNRKIVQENLTQAERYVLYQLRRFSRYRKKFIVSIVADYYSVLKQKNGIINSENNYKRVEESKNRLEMMAEAGRKAAFEVDDAEQRLLASRDGLVKAKQSYQQALDEFKIRLALPTDANIVLDYNELEALEQLGITQPDYTLEAAVETALQQRLDLANVDDELDDAARKVEVAADSLGMNLNLVASAAVSSQEKTKFERLQFHNGTYALGLEADLPLDRKSERNSYRRSLITLQQNQRAYKNYVDEVKLDVRQAYRQLAEAAQRYIIQKNSLELANKRVESISLLVEAGRTSARELLEAQADLLSAENDLTSALVSHVNAKLNFFRDIGVLQVRPDGMWYY
ncbi:MAG: TolC family protein [Sedimentisphaerales bacterium]|nr:TolC family protein [Sedimentisphaerales bacterium]